MTAALEHDNPFIGLRPFDEEDHHLFFGREEHVDEILERIKSHRFLAIVGTSGSGKSSLVRAGVLPRLEQGLSVRGRGFWRVAPLFPGSEPVRRLATALVRVRAGEDLLEPEELPRPDADALRERAVAVELMRASLLRSTLALVDALPRLQLDASENLLIFVDQFEELFRYRGLSHTSYDDEALHFISLLLEVTSREALPAFVVITMRSDFLGECASYPALATAINRGQYLVSLLNRGQRERAIVGPLRSVGVGIEPRLLHLVQAEARDKLDQLPLLEHALMRTFDEWRLHGAGEAGLTEDDYLRAGGMEHALSKHANEAYDSLSPEHQALAEKLFRALTERREDGRAVRRPCRVAEITASVPTTLAAVKNVIEAFQGDNRHFIVVRPQATELAEGSELDIAHESLMRVWDRLAKWTQREVDDAAQLHRLAESVALNRKGAAGLLRDPELAVALKWRERAKPSLVWAARYGIDLNDIQGFIQRSTDAQAKERAEEEHEQIEARERELREYERTRRQNRRLIGVAVTAVLALICVVVFAALYVGQRQSLADATAKAEAVQQNAERASKQANEDIALARAGADAARADGEKARAEAAASRAESEKAKAEAADAASATSTALLRSQAANAAAARARTELLRAQRERSEAQQLARRAEEERVAKDEEIEAAKKRLAEIEARRKKIESLKGQYLRSGEVDGRGDGG